MPERAGLVLRQLLRTNRLTAHFFTKEYGARCPWCRLLPNQKRRAYSTAMEAEQ